MKIPDILTVSAGRYGNSVMIEKILARVPVGVSDSFELTCILPDRQGIIVEYEGKTFILLANVTIYNGMFLSEDNVPAEHPIRKKKKELDK